MVRGSQDGGRTDGQGTGERTAGDAIPEDARIIADTRADQTPDSLVVISDTRIEADTAIVDALVVSDTPVVPPDTSLIVDAPLRDAMGSGTGGSSGTVDAAGGADGTGSSTAGSMGGTAGSSSSSGGAGGSIWTCGPGNHNGGDGTCVPLGTCSNGYHLNDGGGCVVNMDAGSVDAPEDVVRDTATEGPRDAPIELPRDANQDRLPEPKLDAPVCPPGRVGADCKTCRIYVRTDGLESNDGTTWTKSIKSVQQALTMAAAQVSGDATSCEIWVATGTYKPTDDTDRTATFLLRNKVSMFGGFRGDESRLVDRVPAWVTTLSGNIGNAADEKDNSYHVVTGTTGASLDGFTVSGGYADVLPSDQAAGYGAGMYNENASPTVTNCVFTGNTAYRGAGMAVRGSAPNVVNCTFDNNLAFQDGGGMAIYNGSPRVTGCSFIGNSAEDRGGGIFNSDASTIVINSAFTTNSANAGGGIANLAGTPTVTDCQFVSNIATTFGGGLFNTRVSSGVIGCTFADNSAASGGGTAIMNDSQPTVEKCWFIGNGASGTGGGLYIASASPSVTNCIFESNRASYGAGVGDQGLQTSITNCTFTGNRASLYGGGINSAAQDEQVTNTILWNDKAPSSPEINTSEGRLTVSHSIVQGGFSGDTNLADDPLFVGEYDVHLRGDSPAIDQGSDACPTGAPASDMENRARRDITKVPNAEGMHGVDIGVYEYQGSDTSPGTPVPALCPLPEGHWYLGALGQSCEDVCAAHGGCDTAATIGIGSEAGDKTNSLFWTCAAVLNHLGAPATPVFGDVDICLYGFGCEVDSAKGRARCVAPATTARAASDKVRRACACVN